MQTGPYIADRLMPKIVEGYCKRANISYQAFSDEWVLRLEKGTVIRWIVGYKFDINQSAAGELAQDKVATYAALAAAGMPAVQHYLARSLPHELIHEQDLHAVLADTAVVAKPLEGTGGRDVVLLASVDEAIQMIRASGEPAWAISPYYNLQAEYRLIILDGEVLLAYEKTQASFRGALKLFNLNYGALAIDIPDDVLHQLSELAKGVMLAMALRLAAVDVVRMPDNSWAILEVNDGISMEHYARQSEDYKKRAGTVYETIVADMF